MQLATSVTTLILVLMTFAFDQSSFIDLPLTLALLALPRNIGHGAVPGTLAVMTIVIDAFLVLAVFAVWLGCAGFARMRAPLDRIHAVAFVNATSGVCVLIAALLTEGLTTRVLKILLIVGIGLLAGAAMSHATGRALLLRGTLEPEETADVERS